MESARVHASAVTAGSIVDASRDDCIAGYRSIADAVHAHGANLFGQVSHPGRVLGGSRDGSLPVTLSASDTPDERFHNQPRQLPRAMVRELIDSYGDAASRMYQAGLDGVEVLASHGLLAAQFLNPAVNQREDEYGGSDANRLRFIREIAANIRAKTAPGWCWACVSPPMKCSTTACGQMPLSMPWWHWIKVATLTISISPLAPWPV